MDKDVLILAIESSCDETAAAVVKNGREVLSNVIFSQIDLHTIYGGVVPEIASRKHIDKINQALLYGDFMQREECRCDIVRKYPNYAHYLDNRAFLLNLIVYDPTIILGIQKIALINIKSSFGFSQGIDRGAKLGIKWRMEDIQDSIFGK